MGSIARRLGLVSAAVLVTSLCCAPFAMAEAGSYRLWAGETLHPGEKLVSPHAAYSLVMQPDGDLVEVSSTGRQVWASGTKSPQSVLQMQSDGNAVIYAPGHVAVWESHSAGSGAQTIEVQDDENLVLYASGHVAVWTTGQIDPAFVRTVSSSGLNCPCYVMNYSHSIKTKTGLEAGNYTIALRWHATAGQVDGFVVDKSYASANNGFHDPRISVTPFRPLEWGPTYSIEVVAKVLSPVQHWKVGGDTGNLSAEIEGGPGDYDQHLDIDLHADGTWALAGE